MSARAPRLRDVPEVVQTSAMDCGPAALAALLQGHGIPASYGRLREVCQTSVDGTSIDTLEEVARALGLDARQALLPPEAVVDPRGAALPALLVARREDGAAHFVTAWRARRGAVQVMDPASGRRWRAAPALERELLVHTMDLPAAAWLGWMTGPVGLGLLGAWMDDARVPAAVQEALAADAFGGGGWEGPAALLATTRMLRRLVKEGGLQDGTGPLAERLYSAARAEVGAPRTVPAEYWMARPAAIPGHVRVYATPLVVVRGVTAATASGERRRGG